jgi:hypothetical protein
MQEAFGGIINMFFIGLFLLIVISVLGLVVSYTKAFKMKNIIISHIENYEASGCFDAGTACMTRIEDSAKALGYGANIRCPDDFTRVDGLFCYQELEVKGTKDHISQVPKRYRVITQVDLKLPIISNIFAMDFFQVTGDTRVIEIR